MLNRRKNKLHPNQASYLRKKDKEYSELAARGLTGPQSSHTLRIENNSHKLIAGLLALAALEAVAVPAAAKTIEPKSSLLQSNSDRLGTHNFTPFTTIAQAEEYCPPVNGLFFTPNNPTIPNSGGSISGNNHIIFKSTPPKKAVKPKHMDAQGLIKDVQFREANGYYGYNSNNVITCLYSYTNFAGVKTYLGVRGKQASHSEKAEPTSQKSVDLR